MEKIINDREKGILYRRWVAPEPKAVLLLMHGLGAHSGRWDFLADYLQQNSISSYALELKGFGETRGIKGHVDSFRIYIEDALALYSIVKKENPAKDVFLAGESMGALISILALKEHSRIYKGLICISPAFSSKLKLPLHDYLRLVMSLITNPKMQFTLPFTSEMCTRDEGYRDTMDKDPREHRLASSRLLLGIILAQEAAKRRLKSIDIPLLFLTAGEDKLVYVEMSKKVFGTVREKDKKIIHYPGMRHSLSIALGRKALFSDILRWIEERMTK